MPFKKGQSGNPKGRTPGTTPGSKIKKSIEENLPDIVATMIELAKAGDMSAATALLNRIVPALKPQALPVTVKSEAGLVAKGEAIINNTLAGKVAPDVGSQLITALASQAKLIEIEDLAKRIDELEKQHATK